MSKRRRCGGTWRTYEEKITDVNIAVTLFCFSDAYDDKIDTAIVISGDSGLSQTCECCSSSVFRETGSHRLSARAYSSPIEVAGVCMVLSGRDRIRSSQLPDEII